MWAEPYQPHSIPPNWGGHAVTGGPKFQSCHHLAPQRKLRSPKLKYEVLEISEVRDPLKEKCITVILGPFESKVFSHYNCCWGPIWKQSSPLIHCSGCCAHLKARYATLHITVAKGGPRQLPRLPSLKHTTVYKPDNHAMRIWNRLNTFGFIRYVHFLTWCAHVNTAM